MLVRQSLIVGFVSVFCLVSQSCTTGGGNEPPKTSTQNEVKNAPVSYSVYLENSGSLNGYLNVSGAGSFRDAMYSLFTGINGFPEKKALNLNDINTQVIPVARNASAAALDNYISHLDAAQFAKRSQAAGGDQSKSDLRLVIRKVLDSSSRENVSLLVSDCIFSPGKGANAEDFLSQQRVGIQGYFQEKLQSQPLSSLLLQFVSDFDGNYYDQDNTAHPGKYLQRPYYVLCVGPEAVLHQLLDYVNSQFQSRGYHNFVFLTPTVNYDVKPTVRLNTAYYDYQPEKPLLIQEAKKGGADSRFRIYVKTDFSKLPLSESELENPSNYQLSPGFQVEQITKLPTASGGFTHELTLVADKVIKGKLEVSLKIKLPEWVAVTNLNSDRGLDPASLEGKTFGLSSLTGGLYDAYHGRNADPRYFTFAVEIKN
jgi:hypothetical protein